MVNRRRRHIAKPHEIEISVLKSKSKQMRNIHFG